MPPVPALLILWVKKGGKTMRGWANAVDWFWMTFFMVVWISLIATFGYAAVLVALRPPHAKVRDWTNERSMKKA